MRPTDPSAERQPPADNISVGGRSYHARSEDVNILCIVARYFVMEKSWKNGVLRWKSPYFSMPRGFRQVLPWQINKILFMGHTPIFRMGLSYHSRREISTANENFVAGLVGGINAVGWKAGKNQHHLFSFRRKCLLLLISVQPSGGIDYFMPSAFSFFPIKALNSSASATMLMFNW